MMQTCTTLLLDRDDTLVEDMEASTDITRLRFLPHAIEGLKRLADAGMRFFIVTNQSGVGLGLADEKDLLRLHEVITDRLKREGIEVAGIEYCPHKPDDSCDCRKPKTGMWDRLKKTHPDLRPEECLMVGDKDIDVLFGETCGMRTARIRCSKHPITVSADYTVSHLGELADRLLGA